MAVKRMFSSSVTETDSFLELPLKSQALYFHLGMQGDDDGFVANPRAIIRSIGCTARDLKPLKPPDMSFLSLQKCSLSPIGKPTTIYAMTDTNQLRFKMNSRS